MKPAVNIRMPEGMKRVLEDLAEKEFRSLNSVILQFLDEQLKAKGFYWRDDEPDRAE
jgi:hypothetical protein